jgi:hypothetical protein
VPGNDLAIVADQHRIGETKLLDAVGDLPDLLLGMDAGTARASCLVDSFENKTDSAGLRFPHREQTGNTQLCARPPCSHLRQIGIIRVFLVLLIIKYMVRRGVSEEEAPIAAACMTVPKSSAPRDQPDLNLKSHHFARSIRIEHDQSATSTTP